MQYQSFDLTKKKLEKIWNKTVYNNNNNSAQNIIKQNFSLFKFDKTQKFLSIPILNKQDSRYIPSLIIYELSDIPFIFFCNLKTQILTYKIQQFGIQPPEYYLIDINDGSFEYIQEISTNTYRFFIQKSYFGQFSPEPQFLTYIDINLIILNPFIFKTISPNEL